MPKRNDLESILIIGSGPIIIGQACEFDYSGTQACRALKEEGYRIILVNSNPATIMTDRQLAHATYLEPVTPEAIASIIEKEPDVEPEIKGKNIFLERGYVNLYPYGIGGTWHVDSAFINPRTILFYPSDWKEEYGGATEFQESGEKVEYIKNRLLVFDGKLSHRSAVHQNPKNRYTIAFKTNRE